MNAFQTLAYINAVLSLIAVMLLTFAALGWRHSLRGPDYSPEWFFAAAKVALAIAIGFRLLFWDVIWGALNIIDHEYAALWSDAFGRTNVNILSTGLVIISAYMSLKARQLILQQDRDVNWHWLIAWAYPSAKQIVRIITIRRPK